MGRKKWSRKRKVTEAESKAHKPESARAAYEQVVASNAKMEAYYAAQGLHSVCVAGNGGVVPCDTPEEMEAERGKWISSLRQPLPASFRIGRDIPQELRERLEFQLEEFVGKEFDILVSTQDGKGLNKARDAEQDDQTLSETTLTKMAPAKRIPFLPHAYQLSVDRRTLRRNPSLTPLHDWLKLQSDAGFITRQETVSMIPPVVLNPRPTDSVLDICAAPGSKTCQLLEVVGAITHQQLEPTGYVVANDVDAKRAYMLVHQLRRLNSPAVFVTSVDAQLFPSALFDKVLCDVPCSGDGTARKNPGIWRQWNALGAFALHPLQLSIALNGARLTKVGGYMCYSTCSMNPIENEAVVAEILRTTFGSLELVRPDMPGLAARPGWSTWKVLSEGRTRRKNAKQYKHKSSKRKHKRWNQQKKDNVSVTVEASVLDDDCVTQNGQRQAVLEGDASSEVSEEESPRDPWIASPPSWDERDLLERAKSTGLIHYQSFADVPLVHQKRIRLSMFPPTTTTTLDKNSLSLERCMRCLPHDMDTGGFFIALFQKVKPMSSKAQQMALDLANETRHHLFSDNKGGNDDTIGKPAEYENKEEEEKMTVEDTESKTFTTTSTTTREAQMETPALNSTDENGNGQRAETVWNETTKDSNSSVASAMEPIQEAADTENNTLTTASTTTKELKMETPALNWTDENGNGQNAETVWNETNDDSNSSVASVMEPIQEVGDTQEVASETIPLKTDDAEDDIPSNPSSVQLIQRQIRDNNKTAKTRSGDLGNENFVPVDESIFPDIIDFYGLTDTFPKDQFMARASGDAKILYFLTKRILTQLIHAGIQNRLTVVNSGLRAFERGSREVSVRYRPVQEAVHYIVPHMTKRKLVADYDDFGRCMGHGGIRLSVFGLEFGNQMKELCVGPFVVALKGYERELSKKMFLVMWKCRGDAVNCLVSKMELDGMKGKLYAYQHSHYDNEPTNSETEERCEDDHNNDHVANGNTVACCPNKLINLLPS